MAYVIADTAALHGPGCLRLKGLVNLDGALRGRYPGIKLNEGSEVSLDAPLRRPDSPNGVDERLSIDMTIDSKNNGATRLSLAFAAFPEIFDATHPGPLQRVAYRLTHVLNPLIRLEPLYRYLCKFHAPPERRYMVLCAPHSAAPAPPAAASRRRGRARMTQARWRSPSSGGPKRNRRPVTVSGTTRT
jgi:hypothetical protein